MRHLTALGLMALAACAAPVSDDVYTIEREAELSGAPVTGLYAPAGGGAISQEELAAAGIAVSPARVSPGTSYASDAAPAASATVNNPGISDEQDFGAVAERETIQSDRQRIEAQREAYRVIPPQPIEQRPSDTGPNIVAFALNTSNGVGERLYSRTGLNAQNRFLRNCAKYPSSDLAQRDFLERGGPERDRLGLDPDGDGFACYWDPEPFRAARGG